MDLASLQKHFSNYLYNRTSSPEELRNLLQDSGPVSVDTGLSVYRKNLVLGVVEALSTTYPQICSLLEPEGFRFFAREFLYEHPSKSYDLGNFGEPFPRYLANREELKHLPWIEDLGKFEWMWERLEVGLGSFSQSFLKPELALADFEYDALGLSQGVAEFLEKNGENALKKKRQCVVFWREEEVNKAESIQPDLNRFLREYGTSKTLKEIQLATGLEAETTIEMEAYCRSRHWIL